MSLNVSVHLIDQAKVGKVNSAFVETIRESLPYAWNRVEVLRCNAFVIIATS